MSGRCADVATSDGMEDAVLQSIMICIFEMFVCECVVHQLPKRFDSCLHPSAKPFFCPIAIVVVVRAKRICIC